MDLRSWLNLRLRSAARALPPDNPLRRAGARAWNSVLRLTGGMVTLPLQGHPVRLAAWLRSFDLDYESAALGSFLRLIEPGDVVWDVGANIGIYSILAGLRTGAAGKVIAWEPNPETHSLLQAHLRANGLGDRCTPLQAVVHDGSTPRACFVLNAGTDCSTDRVVRNGTSVPGRLIDVEADSLDGWRRRLACTPAAIKIDIEGAEVLALRGAAGLMSEVRPLVLLALHPQFLGEFGCTAADAAGLLRERCYAALDLHGREVEPTEYAEYWLVPEECRRQTEERLREHA